MTNPIRPARATSVDALRGLVMFTMIYVNDLAGGGKIVPDWMVHFSDRHRHGSGMTFVDLVFPGFLFIVGMSIPFAVGSRLDKGEPLWKTVGHIVARTLSLLALGIMMVNDRPNAEVMGWLGHWWSWVMFSAAILAFCVIAPCSKGAPAPGRERFFCVVTLVLRAAGMAVLVWLALAYRGEGGEGGERILSLSPFSIHTSWYGILGLIGWAYLVGSLVFLCFRGRLTALLGCVALLLCLYPADRTGLFNGFWLSRYVGIGEVLGAHPSITVAGVLLGSMLLAKELATAGARARFTLLFIAGTAAGAWLVTGLYGISKNAATPSWCLWSCAITAAIWLLINYVCDVRPVGIIARPLSIAGQNVLLAYLLSEMLPDYIYYGDWNHPHLAWVVVRPAIWSVILLCVTAGLNRVGFRLKL